MRSTTAMVVIYLGLLVPDPFPGARKTPFRGLHYHLGADECCLVLKVTDTEDTSTNTHPDFS